MCKTPAVFADCRDRWEEGIKPLKVLPIMAFLYTKLYYGERRHTVLPHYIKCTIKAQLICGTRGQEGGTPWGQGVVTGLWPKEGF